RPPAPHARHRVHPRRRAGPRAPRHGDRRAPGDRRQGDRPPAPRAPEEPGPAARAGRRTSPGRVALAGLNPSVAMPDVPPRPTAPAGPRAGLRRGGGPSTRAPRVLRAMAQDVLGQFDRAFTAMMIETQALLREVFQTKNGRTFPVSATSRAGMEAAVVSLVEP